jgi:mono/diheme cytochrome c family protein
VVIVPYASQPPMSRTLARLLPLAFAALVVAGCGTQDIDLPGNATASERRGAEIFYARCSACHTFEVAGAQGSAINVNQREYKDGPNFNERAEEKDQVLYAIRNGGFSSGPMPQNIAVGQDAEDVAAFVSKYSGRNIARAPEVGKDAPAGVEGESLNEAP